jgi:hypothetical protein
MVTAMLGDQHGQRVDATKKPEAGLRAEGAHYPIDNPQQKADDEVEQEEHPVFLSAGSAAENRVLPQYFQIPVHAFLLCSFLSGVVIEVQNS